jgi:adenylosuccinate synthase
MRAAVIGLGFGDEGKGMTTDYLCSKFYNPLVVRYSGGHQAGHTVTKRNNRHIFSNFGSGTLSDAPTYWSSFCTIEPIGFIREFNILKSKGITPVLFIDNKCPITTPYDIIHNQFIEKEQNHGTCGVGFGTTIAREESMYSLLAEDLMYSSVTKIKLNLISKFYSNKYNLDLLEFYKCIDELLNIDTVHFVSYCPYYENIIFEGSQGLLLDKNIGFFPHVTRSNTGTKNILKLNINPTLYLVTRAYQTRHGEGIMTNNELSHNISLNKDETNITNKYQGLFKRSLLDIDLLSYGINKDDYIRDNKINATLVITCLDHIKDEYRFTHKGRIVFCDNEYDFVDKISAILGINNLLLSRTPFSDDLELKKIIRQTNSEDRNRFCCSPSNSITTYYS